MKNYLNFLIKQFNSATGTKNVAIDSLDFEFELSDWLINRRAIGEKYIDLLDYMGVNFQDKNCAEVGKGKYDSVVAGRFETSMITPYLEGLKNKKNLIIGSNLRVYRGKPIIVKEGLKTAIISNDSIKTFMIQNPYAISFIKDWEHLHNNGIDIIIGVYGNTFDKDMDFKLKQLSAIKEKLHGSYVEENTKIGDSYVYAIASQRKNR